MIFSLSFNNKRGPPQIMRIQNLRAQGRPTGSFSARKTVQGRSKYPSGRTKAAAAPARQACTQADWLLSTSTTTKRSRHHKNSVKNKVSDMALIDHSHNKGEKIPMRHMIPPISMGTHPRPSRHRGTRKS